MLGNKVNSYNALGAYNGASIIEKVAKEEAKGEIEGDEGDKRDWEVVKEYDELEDRELRNLEAQLEKGFYYSLSNPEAKDFALESEELFTFYQIRSEPKLKKLVTDKFRQGSSLKAVKRFKVNKAKDDGNCGTHSLAICIAHGILHGRINLDDMEQSRREALFNIFSNVTELLEKIKDIASTAGNKIAKEIIIGEKELRNRLIKIAKTHELKNAKISNSSIKQWITSIGVDDAANIIKYILREFYNTNGLFQGVDDIVSQNGGYFSNVQLVELAAGLRINLGFYNLAPQPGETGYKINLLNEDKDNQGSNIIIQCKHSHFDAMLPMDWFKELEKAKEQEGESKKVVREQKIQEIPNGERVVTSGKSKKLDRSD